MQRDGGFTISAAVDDCFLTIVDFERPGFGRNGLDAEQIQMFEKIENISLMNGAGMYAKCFAVLQAGVTALVSKNLI